MRHSSKHRERGFFGTYAFLLGTVKLNTLSIRDTKCIQCNPASMSVLCLCYSAAYIIFTLSPTCSQHNIWKYCYARAPHNETFYEQSREDCITCYTVYTLVAHYCNTNMSVWQHKSLNTKSILLNEIRYSIDGRGKVHINCESFAM